MTIGTCDRPVRTPSVPSSCTLYTHTPGGRDRGASAIAGQILVKYWSNTGQILVKCSVTDMAAHCSSSRHINLHRSNTGRIWLHQQYSINDS